MRVTENSVEQEEEKNTKVAVLIYDGRDIGGY